MKKWRDLIGKERVYSIYYRDKGRSDVVTWDVQTIKPEQLLKVVFISNNSPHRQGIRIAIDVGKGHIEVCGSKYRDILLWWDTAPKEDIIKVVSTEGLISVYNIWDTGRGRESRMYKSGMLLKEEGNKTTYYCTDFGDTEKFDKLVFSIEKL